MAPQLHLLESAALPSAKPLTINMNPRLLLSILLLTLLQFQSNAQTALDSLAMDMCDCLKKSTDSISKKGQRVLNDAAVFDDYDEIEKAISVHFTFDNDQEDSKLLERAMDVGYEKCYDLIDFKYRDFLATIKSENEEEILDLYFRKLKEEYDCGIAKVITILVIN